DFTPVPLKPYHLNWHSALVYIWVGTLCIPALHRVITEMKSQIVIDFLLQIAYSAHSQGADSNFGAYTSSRVNITVRENLCARIFTIAVFQNIIAHCHVIAETGIKAFLCSFKNFFLPLA